MNPLVPGSSPGRPTKPRAKFPADSNRRLIAESFPCCAFLLRMEIQGAHPVCPGETMFRALPAHQIIYFAPCCPTPVSRKMHIARRVPLPTARLAPESKGQALKRLPTPYPDAGLVELSPPVPPPSPVSSPSFINTPGASSSASSNNGANNGGGYPVPCRRFPTIFVRQVPTVEATTGFSRR